MTAHDPAALQLAADLRTLANALEALPSLAAEWYEAPPGLARAARIVEVAAYAHPDAWTVLELLAGAVIPEGLDPRATAAGSVAVYTTAGAWAATLTRDRGAPHRWRPTAGPDAGAIRLPPTDTLTEALRQVADREARR